MSTVTGSFEEVRKSSPCWKLYVCGYNGFKQTLVKDSKCHQVIDKPLKVDISGAKDVIKKVRATLSSAFVLWGDGRISVTGWIPGTTILGNQDDLLPGQDIQDISCADEKLMFVTKAGKLFSWNNYTDNESFPQEVAVGHAVSQVRCGDVRTILRLDNGTVGEVVLNHSKSEKSKNKEDELSLLAKTINFPHQVESIDCGKEHVLLLTTTGKVFSFGGGSRGQLGNGSLEAQIEPVLVEALDGIEVIRVACGGWHSAVISNSGDVYSWGWNKDGQVGVSEAQDDTQPVQVQAIPFPVSLTNDVVAIDVSCGSRHTAVVTSCGAVWTWGWGYYSQLGQGNSNSCFQPKKILAMKSRVSRVWCSHWNTFFLVN